MEAVCNGTDKTMKPVIRRKCVVCGEIKRTTNTDKVYIGEECLRTVLKDQYTEVKEGWQRGAVISLIVLLVGVAIGIVVVKYVL